MIQRRFATSRLNFLCQALGGWFRPARYMIARFQALSGKRCAVRLTGTGLVRQNTHRPASLELVRQMGRFNCVRGTDRHNLHIAIPAPKALVAEVQCVTFLQPAPIRVRPQALRHHTAIAACSTFSPCAHKWRLTSPGTASNKPNRTSAQRKPQSVL